MIDVKSLRVAPISAKDANTFVKKWHYSKKSVILSKLHFGVFRGKSLEGAIQLGASIDKRKLLPLVSGSGLNQFLEINRIAFADSLPKNSESRCLSVVLRIIKSKYPQIKWVVTFADATRCGDGTIYRAANFLLIGAKKNTTMVRSANGKVYSSHGKQSKKVSALLKQKSIPLPGYQLKYIYFLDSSWRSRLTASPLPNSTLDTLGARMHKGVKMPSRLKQATAGTTGTRRCDTYPNAPI